MPTFLFTALNAQGTAITDRVEGATLSAARYKLETQGFAQIRFHTDEMEGHMEAVMADEPARPPRDALTPRKELEARRGGGALREMFAAWKAYSGLWLPLALWNGLSLFEGRPFSGWDWVGFGLSGVFLVYFFWIALPGAAYQKLLEAGVWHRWDDVRRWANFLRLSKRFGLVPIPDLELDFRVAYGVAAGGQLEQALAMVKKHESGKAGRFVYLSRLSGLYEAAGKYDQMTNCRREAIQHGTGNPTEKLDLALGLLRRQRNPAEARPILEELVEHEAGEVVELFLLYCRALLAIEESEWKSADEQFRATMDAAAPYKNNILVHGMLSDIKAYHAIALANLGSKDEASRLFREARQLLETRQETVLLDRCRNALSAT